MSKEKLNQPAPGGDGMRAALSEMLKVAMPAIVTMLSYTAMQFVDLLIVSRLGAEAMAAVGNGTVVAFLPAAAMFGVVGVISTYVSQNVGAGTPERGSGYAWNGLWITLGVWLFVLLPFAVFLPLVQATMRELLDLEINPAVRDLEVVYGRIVLTGMVFTIAARSMSHYFFGVHRPSVVMLAALVGNGLNIPITWGLVTGAWGLPELGVAGAAIGTVIGSFIEMSVLVGVFLSPAFDRAYSTRGAWRLSRETIGDIWRIGWPAGLMFGNELVCWWVFMSGLIATFTTRRVSSSFAICTSHSCPQ
jgi:MATE family multidrug resistance protein